MFSRTLGAPLAIALGPAAGIYASIHRLGAFCLISFITTVAPLATWLGSTSIRLTLQSLTHQCHQLVAHSHGCLGLIAHIIFVIVHAIRAILAFGDHQPQNFDPLA